MHAVFFSFSACSSGGGDAEATTNEAVVEEAVVEEAVVEEAVVEEAVTDSTLKKLKRWSKNLFISKEKKHLEIDAFLSFKRKAHAFFIFIKFPIFIYKMTINKSVRDF